MDKSIPNMSYGQIYELIKLQLAFIEEVKNILQALRDLEKELDKLYKNYK